MQSLYENFECRVIHNNELSDPFYVKTGVKQGCSLSPTLFALAIDWILQQTTHGNRQGIQWSLSSILEDIDYADDIALLSSRHQDIQTKTSSLNEIASTIGLRVNRQKTKIMRNNKTINTPVTIDEEEIEDVKEFTYLGSKMTTNGDCDLEINSRISKAKQAFALLRPIWRTSSLGLQTKIRIFKSNVLSVLLYGSECWKTTNTIERKLEVFQTQSLRRILKIFWPNTISNEDLREKTGVIPLAESISARRWRWIGHVCRMSAGSLPRTALRWTPQGKRSKGRPKETWRRTAERDLKASGLNFETAPRAATDRDKWRSLASASSASRH